MIVNEDDRRIKNIPMINPHNLEGIGMGESPNSKNPVFANIEILTDYTTSVVDEIKVMFADNRDGKTYSATLTETDNSSYIYKGESYNGENIEVFMSEPLAEQYYCSNKKRMMKQKMLI